MREAPLAHEEVSRRAPGSPGLGTIVREWGGSGVWGSAGRPRTSRWLRELCGARRNWLTEEDFEHAVAVTNLLPGPGSTQLAIFCGWWLRGVPARQLLVQAKATGLRTSSSGERNVSTPATGGMCVGGRRRCGAGRAR
jgi:hypothetical protein